MATESITRDVQKRELVDITCSDAMLDIVSELGYKAYTTEEEKAVFEELDELRLKGDTTKINELKQDIALHNIRLVVKIAKQNSYRTNKNDFDDLVQEGMFGLYTAIDRFDVTLGYKFSTYATNWIKQAIFRATDNTDSTIRVPVHLLALYNEIKRVNAKRECLGLAPLNADELKETFNLSDEQVHRCEQVFNILNIASLNKVIATEESVNTELGDFIEDETALVPFDNIINDELSKKISKIIDGYLKDKKSSEEVAKRDRTIIERKFGLGAYTEPETLQSISNDFNISRERVRQVVLGFLNYAKRPSIRKGLEIYCEF